jgi:hypothetical protein
VEGYQIPTDASREIWVHKDFPTPKGPRQVPPITLYDLFHVCVYTFVMSSNKTLKHCLKLTSMYNKTYKTDFDGEKFDDTKSGKWNKDRQYNAQKKKYKRTTIYKKLHKKTKDRVYLRVIPTELYIYVQIFRRGIERCLAETCFYISVCLSHVLRHVGVI